MARQKKRNRPMAKRATGGTKAGTPTGASAVRPAKTLSGPADRADILLAAAFGLLTLLAVVGYPEPKRWIFIAAAAALALLDGLRRVYNARAMTLDIGDAILAALIAYGALSLLWSPNRNGGIQTVIIAGALFPLIVYVKRAANETISTGIAIGAGAAALLALLTNLWLPNEQYSSFANSGYAAEAFVLIVPFMWPLWRGGDPLGRAFAATVAVASIGYVLIYTPSMIEAFVAVLFAAIVSLILAFRRGRWLGWACVLAWAILPPLVAWAAWSHLDLNRRLLVRTELWLDTAMMAAARPLFGHGLGSFIETFPLYKEAHGDLMPFVNTSFESYVTEAEASHNEPVQLLTELGLAGLLPFLALVEVTLLAGVRRLASDRFAAAGTVAVVAVMGEALLEYPFQRAATLFLGVLAFGLAARGADAGLKQWRIRLPQAVPLMAAPIGFTAAALLVIASFRQYEAETLLERSHFATDPTEAFQTLYRAHQIDPLDRRIRTALPIMLDGLVRAKGVDAVPQGTIDQVYAWAEDGGANNTAALVAHAQYLIERDHGDDPDFPRVLALLKRGSARVAAVYAIEARYQVLHGQLTAALATVAEGMKYTDGVSSIPGADAAIKENLKNLDRIARDQLARGAQGEVLH